MPGGGPSHEFFVDAEGLADGAVGHTKFAKAGGAFGDLLVLGRGSGVSEINDQRQLGRGSNSLRPGPPHNFLNPPSTHDEDSCRVRLLLGGGFSARERFNSAT